MEPFVLTWTVFSLALLQLCQGQSVLQDNSGTLHHGNIQPNEFHEANEIHDSLDYWERLVGTPSRLARTVTKEGVLPTSKYSLKTFDVSPFEVWLREHSLLQGLQDDPTGSSAGAPLPAPPPPLASACNVWIIPQYKVIFIRGRGTSSSFFLSALAEFMLERRLCAVNRDPAAAHPNTCVMRLEPEKVAQEGRDVAAMWREYLVITGTRNPWARAASGYQFTYHRWIRKEASCAEPTFEQFTRDPFLLGKMANLFNCSGQVQSPFTLRDDAAWGFDFSQVEPASACMVDDAGKLVVDFVMRYERLDEDMQEAIKLINARRPADLPAIEIPPAARWRSKGTTAQSSDINSTDASALLYADNYRQCGAPCIDALSDFYATDLRFFGWDRPGPPPSTST